jgi:hypothetical protein
MGHFFFVTGKENHGMHELMAEPWTEAISNME